MKVYLFNLFKTLSTGAVTGPTPVQGLNFAKIVSGNGDGSGGGGISSPGPSFSRYIPAQMLREMRRKFDGLKSDPDIQVAPALVQRRDLEVDSRQDDCENPVHPNIADPDGVYGIVSWESPEAIKHAADVTEQVGHHLEKVLRQREADYKFIDHLTRSGKSPIGELDQSGRVVWGPLSSGPYFKEVHSGDWSVGNIPKHLAGPHITMFGPPSKPSMVKKALDCAEGSIDGTPIMWGADNEDSMVPIPKNLRDAKTHLTQAFHLREQLREKESKSTHLSIPIKRIPGIAMPSLGHLYKGKPIPSHIVEFTSQLHQHWDNLEALTFYIPKIENEEEAAYLGKMIRSAEAAIKEQHPEYEIGTVKVIIVFESARSIFRMKEIAYELRDYFIGGSLGWHDFLANVAARSKKEAGYCIPTKLDPEIVIREIKASHKRLEWMMHDISDQDGNTCRAIGGMYGTLPVKDNDASYTVAMKGFVKDVVSQLYRGLDGFWIAHPDFPVFGMELYTAFKEDEDAGRVSQEGSALFRLIEEKFKGKQDVVDELKAFICLRDSHVASIAPDSPDYCDAVLAANTKPSSKIKNNDPVAVAYNVQQFLTYVSSWCMGTGCVALPKTEAGYPVRVMDDLATCERSRRELAHIIQHQQFSLKEFEGILERVHKDLTSESDGDKKWLDVARSLLLKVVTDREPVENMTELMMPFLTHDAQTSDAPWDDMSRAYPKKYGKDIHNIDRLTRTSKL